MKTKHDFAGKVIQFCPNDILLLHFEKMYISQEKDEYICTGLPVQKKETYKAVRFDMEKAYDIFEVLEGHWGDWNECPSAMAMKAIARHWEEKFSIEVESISHDCVGFCCRRSLEEAELELLMREIVGVAPNSVDAYKGKEWMRQSIIEKRTFTLWWD